MRKKYEISLVGCDDETVFEMELTEEELNLLTRVSELSKETSEYRCMPKMYIEEKNDG